MEQYGILAYPAKHSLSPAMFNAAFKAEGIDAQYGIFEIPEGDLAKFMEYVTHEPINGLSVSLPYKEMILHFLNEIDEDAEKIGAVNVVMNKGGFLWGYNTDFIGSNKVLKEVVGDLGGKKVVVVGAGGASRAVVYGLLKEAAEVSVFNRTKEKADGDLQDMLKSKGDILIQTTSIWTLNPEISEEEVLRIFPRDFVAGFDVVMDIVYAPLMTPLLKIAEGFGKKIISGDKMLLYQGAEAFKLWTGDEAPVDVMRGALGL